MSRDDVRVTIYEETVSAVAELAAQAGTAENVLFCERRPLTSLEASFAGVDELARELRPIEDDALRALKRLVDAEQGYETALQAIEAAGADATAWLHAVMLARARDATRCSAAAGAAPLRDAQARGVNVTGIRLTPWMKALRSSSGSPASMSGTTRSSSSKIERSCVRASEAPRQ